MSPLQRSLYCCGGLYQRTSGPSFSELKFRDKQNCSPTAAIISGFTDRRFACGIECGALVQTSAAKPLLASFHLTEGKFSDYVYRSLHAINSNRNWHSSFYPRMIHVLSFLLSFSYFCLLRYSNPVFSYTTERSRIIDVGKQAMFKSDYAQSRTVRSGHHCHPGGIPYKRDGGARRKVRKQPLECTMIMFCARG